MSDFRPLELPSSLVAEENEGWEVVRFWVGGGNDHVTLQLPSDDKGESVIGIWGQIAADIVKHAVRALIQDDPTRNETEILAEIERVFFERLKEQMNFTGTLAREIH